MLSCFRFRDEKESKTARCLRLFLHSNQEVFLSLHPSAFALGSFQNPFSIPSVLSSDNQFRTRICLQGDRSCILRQVQVYILVSSQKCPNIHFCALTPKQLQLHATAIQSAPL